MKVQQTLAQIELHEHGLDVCRRSPCGHKERSAGIAPSSASPALMLLKRAPKICVDTVRLPHPNHLAYCFAVSRAIELAVLWR